MGDGILASFSSTTQAVLCASEIQQHAKEEKIPLKIGIHEGEVVFERGDVFGDGVNIASRIQSIAESNCIVVSETVYKEIRNKSWITTEFIQETQLKNIEEPVKIYKVLCKVDKVDSKAKIHGKRSYRKRSVASWWIAGIVLVIVLGITGWYLGEYKGVF